MRYSSPIFFTQSKPVWVGDLGSRQKSQTYLWFGSEIQETTQKIFLKRSDLLEADTYSIFHLLRINCYPVADKIRYMALLTSHNCSINVHRLHSTSYILCKYRHDIDFTYSIFISLHTYNITLSHGWGVSGRGGGGYVHL
jgi:hypothetical protein